MTAAAGDATSKPVRLRAGWYVSERRYRPKLCGAAGPAAHLHPPPPSPSCSAICPPTSCWLPHTWPTTTTPATPPGTTQAWLYDIWMKDEAGADRADLPLNDNTAPTRLPSLPTTTTRQQHRLQYDEDDLDDQLPFDTRT
ncbi:hypothetical protein Hamer_G006903 [Homarus americanus]|uniref:Uncharacterized protein n=1 Tax=Homarus americanus TaxID=6706 RepID=A0A8J5TIH9_HOMAM|nr:hypothetical protein Hamer_G006903 [Homarus americanus]